MIDRQAEAKVIAEFKRLEIGWTMLLDDGWWAYYNDEKPLGAFAREGEAARAGLKAWGKENWVCGPRNPQSKARPKSRA
jgi:hypothetical protein